MYEDTSDVSLQEVRTPLASSSEAGAEAKTSAPVCEMHESVLECAPEIWKPLVETSGYIVSSTGRIARLVGNTVTTQGYMEAMLPQPIGGYGARRSRDRSGWRVLVHHAIALTFLGPPPPGKKFINHKDGNQKNNAVENLEWVSQQENTQHAWDLKREKCTTPHFMMRQQQIDNIVRLFDEGYTMLAIARAVGCHQSTVLYWLRKKKRKRGRK